MTYPLPAGLEAFAKCPVGGCAVMVYGLTNTANPCRFHGGAPTFQTAEDEYGLPLENAAGPSPAASLRSPEAT